MSVEMKIDYGPWEESVRNLRAVSSRDMAAIVNNSAGSVALKCYKWTKRASRRKIRDSFKRGISVANAKAFTKTGRLRKNAKLFKTVYKFQPWVYGKMRKKYPGSTADQLEEYAKHFYAKTQAAVGYLSFGWKRAILAFGKRFTPDTDFRMTHEYGLAEKATPGVVVEAMLGNDAEYAVKLAGPALQIALDQEAAEIRFETMRRLTKLAAKK